VRGPAKSGCCRVGSGAGRRLGLCGWARPAAHPAVGGQHVCSMSGRVGSSRATPAHGRAGIQAPRDVPDALHASLWWRCRPSQQASARPAFKPQKSAPRPPLLPLTRPPYLLHTRLPAFRLPPAPGPGGLRAGAAAVPPAAGGPGGAGARARHQGPLDVAAGEPEAGAGQGAGALGCQRTCAAARRRSLPAIPGRRGGGLLAPPVIADACSPVPPATARQAPRDFGSPIAACPPAAARHGLAKYYAVRPLGRRGWQGVLRRRAVTVRAARVHSASVAGGLERGCAVALVGTLALGPYDEMERNRPLSVISLRRKGVRSKLDPTATPQALSVLSFHRCGPKVK
jgi:hypothetical protein